MLFLHGTLLGWGQRKCLIDTAGRESLGRRDDWHPVRWHPSHGREDPRSCDHPEQCSNWTRPSRHFQQRKEPSLGNWQDISTAKAQGHNSEIPKLSQLSIPREDSDVENLSFFITLLCSLSVCYLLSVHLSIHKQWLLHGHQQNGGNLSEDYSPALDAADIPDLHILAWLNQTEPVGWPLICMRVQVRLRDTKNASCWWGSLQSLRLPGVLVLFLCPPRVKEGDHLILADRQTKGTAAGGCG